MPSQFKIGDVVSLKKPTTSGILKSDEFAVVALRGEMVKIRYLGEHRWDAPWTRTRPEMGFHQNSLTLVASRSEVST